MHIYPSGAGSHDLESGDEILVVLGIVCALLVVGSAIIGQGHLLDSTRIISGDSSNTSHDITITVKNTELGYLFTKLYIKVENESGQVMLFDNTRAVLVQDGREFDPVEKNDVPGIIYDGTTEWDMRFKGVEKDDFMLRLILTGEDGKFIPFEIDVGVG